MSVFVEFMGFLPKAPYTLPVSTGRVHGPCPRAVFTAFTTSREHVSFFDTCILCIPSLTLVRLTESLAIASVLL